MPTLSAYCKAYPVNRLAQYAHWVEINSRVEMHSHSEDEYLFVHDNYVVTRGIFLDEDVAFNDLTPEWIAFCEADLKFKVPADVVSMNARLAEHGQRTNNSPAQEHCG